MEGNEAILFLKICIVTSPLSFLTHQNIFVVEACFIKGAISEIHHNRCAWKHIVVF
jgi:hypothetical protein